MRESLRDLAAGGLDVAAERPIQVIAMDETPVMELGGPGKTLKGYLWSGVGDADHPYDCFFYSSDRRTVRPQEYLRAFEGYLLADAYTRTNGLVNCGLG